MANAKQVKALVQSHAAGDDSRFYAVAMQMAAQAARSGHSKFAQELRDLVDQAKSKTKARAERPAKSIPFGQPRGELAGLLAVSYPKTRIADMALQPEVEQRLKRVILEQRQRAKIREHGYAPMRKLLLVGPPGTGKTLTASALAGELGLALFTIQLHGLITRFLGETAAKLRLVFDAIRDARGVYLFDEFDALGGQRTTLNDVGEIRRVLNSFLQYLEQDDSDSLIVSATNHPDLLDTALFRRFDSVVRYELPDQEIALRVMQNRLGPLDTSNLGWDSIGGAGSGLSHANLVHACDQAAKDAILEQRTAVSPDDLVRALNDRQGHQI